MMLIMPFEGVILAGSAKTAATSGDANPLALLDESQDVFGEKETGVLPPHAAHDHVIKLETILRCFYSPKTILHGLCI